MAVPEIMTIPDLLQSVIDGEQQYSRGYVRFLEACSKIPGIKVKGVVGVGDFPYFEEPPKTDHPPSSSSALVEPLPSVIIFGLHGLAREGIAVENGVGEGISVGDESIAVEMVGEPPYSPGYESFLKACSNIPGIKMKWIIGFGDSPYFEEKWILMPSFSSEFAPSLPLSPGYEK